MTKYAKALILATGSPMHKKATVTEWRAFNDHK
jgi:hypothetical protein